MSIQFQIEATPDYSSAKFTGAGTAEEIWRQFEFIAEYCNRANKNKLILDFREAYVEVSLVDRYFLVVGAQIFAHYNLKKVAVVLRPEQPDPGGFDETVIQNRGVNLRIFTNIEDAEEWLLK